MFGKTDSIKIKSFVQWTGVLFALIEWDGPIINNF